MDNSSLFSHPDTPQQGVSAEAAEKGVEYPTFSDRPDTETGTPNRKHS